MGDCILSPSKAHQHLDNLQEYAWQQQLLSWNAVDTAMTLSPSDLLLDRYNSLDYDFEDWPKLNDTGFNFMLSTLRGASTPLELGPESPGSNSSATSAEGLFDDIEIDSNVLSGHLDNKPAATCRAFLKDFPDLPSLQYSQPGSSDPVTEHPLLSPGEFQELCAIAMPALEQSPDSLDSTSSPKSEPEVDSQARKNTPKRKPAKPTAKLLSSKYHTAHNMVEKRYRRNINDKIAALRDCVPSLRVTDKGNPCSEDLEGDLDSLSPAQKLNKATVLSKAVEYIAHLEKRNKCLTKECQALKVRIDAFEILVIGRHGPGLVARKAVSGSQAS